MVTVNYPSNQHLQFWIYRALFYARLEGDTKMDGLQEFIDSNSSSHLIQEKRRTGGKNGTSGLFF